MMCLALAFRYFFPPKCCFAIGVKYAAMSTHWLVVPRTARYVTLGDIEGPLSEVWFVCHGYGQLASEILASARVLEDPRRLLVAPEGLSRFYDEGHEHVGASWMTREDRDNEMEDYVRYLDLLHDQVFAVVDRPSVRLILLGFSQGSATASRWAVRGRAEVDHLIVWGAALPPELDDPASLEPLSKMRVSLVAGTRDGLFPERAREEQRSRLRRHGITFSELGFEGGHRLDDDTLLELAANLHR